jgi:arsenate reductase (thioredoxin)
VTTPAVLFLCIDDAGHSQMAAGWLEHLAQDRAVAFPGGSEPADAVNPAAVEAIPRSASTHSLGRDRNPSVAD